MTVTEAKVRRNVILIDEEKCNGCGDCIPGCPEGAIQLIDGKARLVGEILCDGLGACLGKCPVGAITIEERAAAPYDERQVMANVVKQGRAVVQAHLQHLRNHQETDNLRVAMEYLHENNLPVDAEPVRPPTAPAAHGSGGCPGSRTLSFAPVASAALAGGNIGKRPSQLTHWPIQLHLLNPRAPHFQGSDLLLAADCVPFALGDFHKDFLRNKTLAIACPKLDDGQEIYVEKLRALIDEAKVNTVTVMIMQVPCCGGLLALAREAATQAARKVPLKAVVVSLQGEILQEQWVNA